MGKNADDMIDGTSCQLCGCYFQDAEGYLYTHGFPVVCWDCWEDLTEEEKQMYIKADVETI